MDAMVYINHNWNVKKMMIYEKKKQTKCKILKQKVINVVWKFDSYEVKKAQNLY